jgi:hypothetical protein
MNVGIIDADLIGRSKHRFPNLACMKLSAYYKSVGNTTKLILDYNDINKYDKVFISKVFTDTIVPDGILALKTVEYGGTGFYFDKAPPLSYEIEHIMPDYHLYDEWINIKISKGANPREFAYYTDYSIGFMTRGCIRQCKFCVNQNYKQCNLHSPVSEFLDVSRPYICLWDDNVFACKDWRNVFKELQGTGKRFMFRQGLDERLLNDEKCDVLFNKSKWLGDYIFAFDNIKDGELIESKLKLIRKYTDKTPKFYLFCGFNHDDPDHYTNEFWAKDIKDLFRRVEILMKHKSLPYVMRYKDYELSPYRGMYINIARWCNQPSFFKKKSFREFCEANGSNSSCFKYMNDFEQEHTEIAKRYFDLKYDI